VDVTGIEGGEDDVAHCRPYKEKTVRPIVAR